MSHEVAPPEISSKRVLGYCVEDGFPNWSLRWRKGPQFGVSGTTIYKIIEEGGGRKVIYESKRSWRWYSLPRFRQVEGPPIEKICGISFDIKEGSDTALLRAGNDSSDFEGIEVPSPLK